MTPISPSEAVLHQLQASGGVAAGPILRAAVPGISQAGFSRLIQGLRERVVVLGQKRAAQYALLRNVRGLGSRFPVYVVDEAGKVTQGATLIAVGSSQYWVEMEGGVGGLYPDIPFFIDDMRPQGFLGRTFSARHPDLDLPARITDWNRDHVMTALATRGEDFPGNLVIGETSLHRLLERRDTETPIAESDRPARFDALAAAAIGGQLPGSSAGGEQLKFTALLARPDAPQAAIVKFSPPLATESGRRWADLLVCEALALQFARAAGIPSARAEVLFTGERAYLQVDRFDRVGTAGRRGVVTLGALDDQLFGQRDTPYIEAAGRLEQAKILGHEECEHLRWIGVFGSLIANSDMHYGNISLFFDLGLKYQLAPLYDMLPMRYAPQGDEVIARDFEPAVPLTAAASQWKSAGNTAAIYWQAVSEDERISVGFRAIAAANHEKVAKMAEKLAAFEPPAPVARPRDAHRPGRAKRAAR